MIFLNKALNMLNRLVKLKETDHLRLSVSKLEEWKLPCEKTDEKRMHVLRAGELSERVREHQSWTNERGVRPIRRTVRLQYHGRIVQSFMVLGGVNGPRERVFISRIMFACLLFVLGTWCFLH